LDYDCQVLTFSVFLSREIRFKDFSLPSWPFEILEFLRGLYKAGVVLRCLNKHV
jgi:hypothetical protein